VRAAPAAVPPSAARPAGAAEEVWRAAWAVQAVQRACRKARPGLLTEARAWCPGGSLGCTFLRFSASSSRSGGPGSTAVEVTLSNKKPWKPAARRVIGP
jgi:hypothetical protein